MVLLAQGCALRLPPPFYWVDLTDLITVEGGELGDDQSRKIIEI